MMMKLQIYLRAFLFSVMLFFINTSSAQITWQKLFSQRSTDVFRSVTEVPAGGYIVAGYTSNLLPTDTNAFIVRLDVTGDTLWTKTIDRGRKDVLYKVRNTTDNGFILCGYTNSYGAGLDDAWYLKTNAAGDTTWSKTYGFNYVDHAQEIIQTADGGYAMVGYTKSILTQNDGFLVKINPNGDTAWTKTYGGTFPDDINSIKQLADGGYILAGQTYSAGLGNGDIWLVRTNSIGDTLWTKTIGTTGSDNADYIQIATGINAGFIIAGHSDGLGAGDDGYIVRTDTGGTVQWIKIYGGAQNDDFHQVENTSDGGFILVGTTQSTVNAISNEWLVKTNDLGDTSWTKQFGGENHDHAYGAQQTLDNGYIVCGYSSSFGHNIEDAYIIKLNNAGVTPTPLIYTAVDTLFTPANNRCVGGASQVTVHLTNYGNGTVASVPVTVEVTGAITQTLNQTYPFPLAPGAAANFTFTATVPVTAGGAYNFHCITSNNNDVYPEHNYEDTTINILNYSVPPTATDSFRCGTGSVTLTASSPDSLLWYNASTGGTYLGSGATFNTQSISSTTTYYVQAGSYCPSTRVAVLASINAVSSSPTTSPGQRCGTGSVVLTASATDSIRWYSFSTGGTPLAGGNGDTLITDPISITTTFYAEAGITCPSARVSAVATINPLTNPPTTFPASRCGAGTVHLVATGGTINWYDVAVGGVPFMTGNILDTFVYVTTTLYVETGTGLQCPNRLPIVATINTISSPPLVASSFSCGAGSVTLTASSSDPINWYANATGGSSLHAGSPYTTPVISTTTIYWVQAGTACPSARVADTAFVFPPAIVNLGADIMTGATSYNLDAGAGFVSYLWTPGGETTQTITTALTGDYCVTVTDTNGCTANDCVHIDFFVGVNEINSSDGFVMYPNPSSGEFVVCSSLFVGGAQLKIVNMLGEIVFTTTLNSKRQTLNPKLNAGIYFVEMISEINYSTKKLFIN